MSKTEREILAVEYRASCNMGRCPDTYEQWNCPMEEKNKCIDVEKGDWLAAFDEIDEWIAAISPSMGSYWSC